MNGCKAAFVRGLLPPDPRAIGDQWNGRAYGRAEAVAPAPTCAVLGLDGVLEEAEVDTPSGTPAATSTPATGE